MEDAPKDSLRSVVSIIVTGRLEEQVAALRRVEKVNYLQSQMEVLCQCRSEMELAFSGRTLSNLSCYGSNHPIWPGSASRRRTWQGGE